MRLIARKSLLEFGMAHPNARSSLHYLIGLVEAAHWQSPADVVAQVSKAKQVTGDRFRFEVAGGQFRVIMAFNWSCGIAFVKFVGTHAAYDKINATTVSQF